MNHTQVQAPNRRAEQLRQVAVRQGRLGYWVVLLPEMTTGAAYVLGGPFATSEQADKVRDKAAVFERLINATLNQAESN